MTGYDGLDYAVGDRVEIHPGTDLWMRGARYGTVVGTAPTKDDAVRVTLDKTGSKVWTGPQERFRKV